MFFFDPLAVVLSLGPSNSRSLLLDNSGQERRYPRSEKLVGVAHASMRRPGCKSNDIIKAAVVQVMQ